MTCDECRDRLDALARGPLAAGQQTAIEQHLLECESCRADFEATEALASVTAALPHCTLRPDCRWWRQEGRAACERCPQLVTESYATSPSVRQAADPETLPAAV